MGQGLWVELATQIVSNITIYSKEIHLKKLAQFVDLDLYNITFSDDSISVVTLDIKREVFYSYIETFIFDMIKIQHNTTLSEFNINNIEKTLRLPDFDQIMESIANGICGHILTVDLHTPSYVTKDDIQFSCTGIKFLSAYKFYLDSNGITFDYFINLLRKTSSNPLRNAVIIYTE